MVLMLALPAALASTGATAATGMSAMTVTGPAARLSPLTLLLALFMVGYVMWLANHLTALAPARTTGTITTTGTGYLAPRCAACCKIAMGTTMGYMLIMML
jgi:hypothetical protein